MKRTLVFWLVLFYTRQAAESKSVQELKASASELKKSVDTVRDAVFTLPPESFMTGLSQDITSVYTSFLSKIQRGTSLNREELTDVICTLLKIVARLGLFYDDQRPARYEANVMVFIPSHDADPYFNLEKFSKEDIRRFFDKTI